LGEVLITTYVSTFASFTTLARLGMALRLLVFPQVTIKTGHTSDEEVHHRGQPFWMKEVERKDKKNYEA
jgi:hypothetical protein